MASVHTPMVHLFAGLNGVGKTTLARKLERELPAVRFSLDEWMLRLHQLAYDDPRYGPLAGRCQELMWDLAKQVLNCGSDVVLDWNQWSRGRRAVWRDRALSVGAVPILHHFTIPVEVAIARAAARHDAESHRLTGDAIRHLTSLFEPPQVDEGIVIEVVSS